MPSFLFRSKLPVPARELWEWHMREGAIERLTPPWSVMKVLEGHGRISDTSRRVLRVPAGPFRMKWVARHHSFIEGRRFVDEQISGPFKSWVHTHRFVPDGDNTCTLEDSIDYEIPFGTLGRLASRPGVNEIVHRVFPWRHLRTQHDMGWHARYLDRPRLKIAITGASGLIGKNLTHFLTTGGHTVYRLVRRNVSTASDEIVWNPSTGEIDSAKLENLDAVIHLAGKSIAGWPFNEAHKRAVYDSRIQGTRLLARTLAGLKSPPEVLLSASAMGIYGDRNDERLDDSSAPGDGFLAEVCRDWEAEADPVRDAGIRVVHPRISLVISSAGGSLKAMLPAFRMGVAGRLGSGKQWMSWISLDDLIGALYWMIYENSISGPVNMSTPDPVTNKEFTKSLGRVLKRPTTLPAPEFVLRALLGEMADQLLLCSTRLSPSILEANHFPYSTPTLNSALKMEFGRLEKRPESA